MPTLTIHQHQPLAFQLLTEHWKAWITILLLGYFVASMILSVTKPGLRHIPGPLLARFSRYFLVREATKGNGHTLYRSLHEKYGKIVRVGPNKLAISDPDMIDAIYGITSQYKKVKGAFYNCLVVAEDLQSTFYDAFTASYNGKIMPNLFATRDIEWHKNMKTSVAHAYSVSYLRQVESLVHECNVLFMDAMRDFAGQPIDFGKWLQWYAFDVIGEITFSQTFGFMSKREDSLEIIDGLEGGNKYNSVIGQIPELHPWLLGNDKLLKLLMSIPALAKANPVKVLDKMMLDAMSSNYATGSIRRGDFLDYLRKVQEKDPERLPDRDISTALLSNLFAGSDTTAMALRAIFYFLVKNPKAYQKLNVEIEQADEKGLLSDMVQFQQGLKLTYLQAVIKESLRLHPGVGYPLERVVPKGGATLCGIDIPAGTVVGMHAWVIHHDRNVFGEDADEFRPERWLESSSGQLKKMERCFMSFGYGSRVCMGKNISLLEVTILVPQVLREFDLAWASPDEEWKISGYFFAKQSGVIMRLSSKNVSPKSKRSVRLDSPQTEKL